MISLALKGKVPVSEDALTAALLDTFRHHSANGLLLDILSKARCFVRGHSIPTFDSADIELWPQLKGREPDARLLLKRGSVVVCHLVVESKIGAGKTGEGELDENGEGDQLAAYLLAEAASCSDAPACLLYLTHHAARPSADLDASAEALRSAGRDDLIDGLNWLSWRDVEELLHNSEPRGRCSDVAELLRRVKLYRFNSFDVCDILLEQGPRMTYLTGRLPSEHTRTSYFKTDAELGILDSREWNYRRGYEWPIHLARMNEFGWQYRTRSDG